MLENLGVLSLENRLVRDQFRQFLVGTHIAAIIGILNLITFGDNLTDANNILFFRLDLIAFVVGTLLTTPLFILLNRGQYKAAVTLFLWLWSVVMAFTTWFEGGLYSPLILSFPVIFIFTVLFTRHINFIAICGFLIASIVFMGLNHAYDWFPSPEGMMIGGTSRMISTLVLTTLAGHFCWIFGRMLKSSFEELKLENQRVVVSQGVITKLASFDSLTGSLNRTGAESAYQSLLETIDFNHECIVGYFIDLDDFKNINDLFDHNAGDQLLITMSHRLNALLSENGFVCRFGGDEFVLILRAARGFDVEGFADKILESLARPHTIFGSESEVTASIGIKTDCDNQSSFSSICKQADMAMYKAKQSGKNKYHVYSDQLQQAYMRRLNILNNLKNAISNGDLDVYFQPKINLQTNKIDGAEALLRWVRGNAENIGPEEFIPMIESTELIHSVGAWVINEACDACKKWQAAGTPLKVAVNASALQLIRPCFALVVESALSRHKLSPALLEIEITEHSLIKETAEVKMQLETIKTLGVSLAIDDFGTGYSNMGYLTRLKIDVLKLDRSFVSQVSQSAEHHVVVTAIIKMAHVLGMKVVAEGIETEQERDVLKALRCDMGQGYLWSKAVSGADLLKVIGDFQQDA